MVCLRDICINTLHKDDYDDVDNNNNNNNNNNNKRIVNTVLILNKAVNTLLLKVFLFFF